MTYALVVLGMALLIGWALWTVNRERAKSVSERDVGGINAFEAYYGKRAFRYAGTAPCDACAPKGCVGAGECRCRCHAAKG